MPVNTTTGAPLVINVGAVGIAGSVAGMPLEAMILGAIAGAVAHGLNRAGTRHNGIVTVLTSTILAGALSPAVAYWLAAHVELGTMEEEMLLLKPLVPVLIGAAWPWSLPLLHDGVKRLWDSWISRLGGKQE
ncbi:MAG: hypothetical protein Q4G28_02120 [Neisseria sp.]|nr:hypothetical protein [Neisseria sp.]